MAKSYNFFTSSSVTCQKSHSDLLKITFNCQLTTTLGPTSILLEGRTGNHLHWNVIWSPVIWVIHFLNSRTNFPSMYHSRLGMDKKYAKETILLN